MKTVGSILVWVAWIGLGIVDLYSLALLANQEGIVWAFVAFIIVPAQAFVPFLVGTWPAMIIGFLILLLGLAISKDNKSQH